MSNGGTQKGKAAGGWKSLSRKRGDVMANTHIKSLAGERKEHHVPESAGTHAAKKSL